MEAGSLRSDPVRLLHFKNAAVHVVRDMDKNHTMAFAAALSYYFVLALFPFLIFLSAVVAHLPLPDFFSQVMGLVARIVPAASMDSLRNLMKDTILSRHNRLLTFGILFTLWSALSGFTALIEALNTAYNVAETRRYWKTRGVAFGLTFSVGCLLVIALGLLLIGPSLSAWFNTTARVGRLWPYVRWSVAIACTVLAVELLYFVAPNVKYRFVSTLPGALIAVGGWIGLSYLLGIYFQDLSEYSKSYGSLGVALAFGIWLYWTGFVTLIGAQFNSELLQEVGGDRCWKRKRRTKPDRPRNGRKYGRQRMDREGLDRSLETLPARSKGVLRDGSKRPRDNWESAIRQGLGRGRRDGSAAGPIASLSVFADQTGPAVRPNQAHEAHQ